MPRNYTRKTNRAHYDSASLQEALRLITDGEPIKSVARRFGISPKTLRRHRDKKVSSPGQVKLGHYSSDLGDEYEKLLVQKIQEMEKALFGLTGLDVRRLAFEFANRVGMPHRFNAENKMADPDWLSGFLKRHPELSLRKPEPVNLVRAVGFNKPKVDEFYKVLKEALSTETFTPTRIWNMDETGISNVQKPGNIIATKGAREVGRVTSGERGKTVTVLCALNAAGTYVPPMFIFGRKRMADALLNGAPPGSVSACTDNGWTDGDCFLIWLKHFYSYCKADDGSETYPHLGWPS
ncbi:Uncharacterised protein r2_g520 [Pycnogonum litorale]